MTNGSDDAKHSTSMSQQPPISFPLPHTFVRTSQETPHDDDTDGEYSDDDTDSEYSDNESDGEGLKDIEEELSVVSMYFDSYIAAGDTPSSADCREFLVNHPIKRTPQSVQDKVKYLKKIYSAERT